MARSPARARRSSPSDDGRRPARRSRPSADDRSSTAAAVRSCPVSSTRTRTSCSPATAATNCGGGSPARRTPRSPPRAAASCRRCARRRAASEDELAAADAGAARRDARGRARRPCEAKSGYGLDIDDRTPDAARHRGARTTTQPIELAADVHGRARSAAGISAAARRTTSRWSSTR